MIARMGEREEGLTTWIRAACADGRLKADAPLFASMQLQGMVKGLAFWPQVSLGLAPLTTTRCEQLGDLRELGVVCAVERNTGADSQTSLEWSPRLPPSA